MKPKPTLIVPDVHEDFAAARQLVDGLAEYYDRVVFLGDMFDSFNPRSHETATLYYQWLQNPKVTVLVGNHDMQYLATWPELYRCSGYENVTRSWVHDALFERGDFKSRLGVLDRVDIAADVHGWLVSHAGVNLNWVKSQKITKMFAEGEPTVSEWADFLNRWFHDDTNKIEIYFERGRASRGLFAVDEYRGGSGEAGGPLWADWAFLKAAPVQGLNQIVGHTLGNEPRWKPDVWADRYPSKTDAKRLNLDTALRNFALVYPDGQVNVYPIDVPGSIIQQAVAGEL